MKIEYQYIKYVIAINFIWLGFVGAISFMEAWLKFQAPGITTEIGLGIGQLVFNALNKVEITCALAILVVMIYSKPMYKQIKRKYFLGISLLILGLQTIWLLPALDHRADLIIQGVDVPKSRLHLWYVLFEILKVISLFAYGMMLFKIYLEKSSTKKI
ncbi:hypothetical protein AWE51_16120 [Aquimarina aggregata]|uniref:DUF4149 domain-containing protein n=1 Tax=Aquimarina aggregata TaxID=1642818 RepID=A0A163D025_9FLAO|nr:hypothetical protein [Aquimarina aggregata]KZS42892.1 hypothetical protein AWE51_16120 [Aquimarina aggregata]